MQSCVVRSATLSNPMLGQRMSLRVAPTPAPAQTAFRQVTAMAKKKGVRIIVTVECTEAEKEGGTPSRYCTQKVRHRGAVNSECWPLQHPPQQLSAQPARSSVAWVGACSFAEFNGAHSDVCAVASTTWGARPPASSLCCHIMTLHRPALLPHPQNRRNTPDRLELMKYNPNLK